MIKGRLLSWLLFAYAAALVLGVTWPFLAPGEALAYRDMLVLPDMALTRAALGFGDLPARNVPQDALLAVLPFPVAAVRALVVGAAAAAAWAGWRIGSSGWGRFAAITVAVWNPFVVERLLQGQWSVAVAAWLLPLVALGARGSIAAQWVCSLSPTGAIAAALHSRRWLFSALTCAPWVVAGALAAFGGGEGTSSAQAAAMFAPRAEAGVGTLGALLGLGGIWNAHAVPASRASGFAIFGVLLFAVLCLAWRHVPRRLLVLAGLGFALALASWAGLLTPIIQLVPGGGLLRDAHKLLILAIPAYVTAAGNLPGLRAQLAGSFALLQLLDAPFALSALTPVPASSLPIPHVDDQGRDVFFVDRPTLTRRADGTTIVDPAPKMMNVVESGALRVGAVQVDPPSPRWSALNADVGLAASMGVGVVVYPDGRSVNTGAAPVGLPPLGLGLFGLWCVSPLIAVLTRRIR